MTLKVRNEGHAVFHHVGLHPIASKIATAKILCWEQIPGEVGFALVSATWDDHLSRREVPKATFVEL
jgi:hypothetical protein